jgi:hypothetical protein
MNAVQIFIGCTYYPQGGADDLQKTLFNRAMPSDQELCELFRQFVAANQHSGNSSFWLNACAVGDETVRVERWLAYTTGPGAALPPDRAPYVTAQVVEQGVRYSLVAIERRTGEDGEDEVGPKGHPEVVFF